MKCINTTRVNWRRVACFGDYEEHSKVEARSLREPEAILGDKYSSEVWLTIATVEPAIRITQRMCTVASL